MATSSKTPYEILHVDEKANDFELRKAYRRQIHALIYDEISDEEFRCICRAYETLSDYDRRDCYDQNQVWTSHIPIENYTLQQLAAEPSLFKELKKRLRNATLREINAQNPSTGHTALYCAARVGNSESVSYLTDQGAEPDFVQRTESTALHAASFYGHANIVRHLLKTGANYCKRNAFDHTAEEEASSPQVAQVFIRFKTDPYVQAAANQLDWFRTNQRALEKHIDEQYYRQRQTLLHCACKKGHFELVCWFVEQRQANLDIVDRNQNSALHLAAYAGHESIVEYLLHCGADSTLINKWSMTAEQEGARHGNKISQYFRNIRKLNMFEKAREGVLWWFQYHFGDLSPDSVDSRGISLLFYACRYGQLSTTKWLLDQGANVNIQLKAEPHSTPLHTACLHGHLEVVEVLLAYGADVTIQNDYGDTIFYEIKTDAIKQLLQQHRRNLHEHKLLSIHLYSDDQTSTEPIAKVQVSCEVTFDDLLKVLPSAIRSQRFYLSIARRPLVFKDRTTTIISAVCCARYGSSKLIDVPLRLTIHQLDSSVRKNDLSRVDPSFDFCEFNKRFYEESEIQSIKLKFPVRSKTAIDVHSLRFEFSAGCVNKNVTIDVRTLFSPDTRIYGLSECICLFKTDIFHSSDALQELPSIHIIDHCNARLYTLALPSPYWFTYDARQTRLPMIGGIHAFVRYVTIIPKLLSLPADMFLDQSLRHPLISRTHPVECTSLQLRKHNPRIFPHICYHGTNIKVIRSILLDGLVVPGTLVASGDRISPPAHHIPRGHAAFGLRDFADAIFLSPSIHYSSDTAYALPFATDNDLVQVILECSVRDNSFSVHQCTVSTYRAHTDDDLKTIEWRICDPSHIEINSILFIPITKSKRLTMKTRMMKLEIETS